MRATDEEGSRYVNRQRTYTQHVLKYALKCEDNLKHTHTHMAKRKTYRDSVVDSKEACVFVQASLTNTAPPSPQHTHAISGAIWFLGLCYLQLPRKTVTRSCKSTSSTARKEGLVKERHRYLPPLPILVNVV